MYKINYNKHRNNINNININNNNININNNDFISLSLAKHIILQLCHSY